MDDEPPGRLAPTPPPPYTAVIFTSLRSEADQGYAAMARAMEVLAAAQPGYLGIEAAREDVGITVSYWRDEQSAQRWKQVGAHLVAQQRGRDIWYRDYRVRVATVVREYGPPDGHPRGAGPSDAGTSDAGTSGAGPSGAGPSSAGASSAGASIA